MKHQRGRHDIEFIVAEWHVHRVGDAERHAGKFLLCVFDLRQRGIDADDLLRRAAALDQVAERPGAAADIEPARAGRRIEPGEEFLADRAAPAPHEALVVVGGIEGDLG